MYYMNYAEIGKRIAEKRKKLRMTQAEVEDKAGLSHKYLSNIEHGRSVPSIDVLMQIADVLHSAPNEFLLGAASVGGGQTGGGRHAVFGHLQAFRGQADGREEFHRVAGGAGVTPLMYLLRWLSSWLLFVGFPFFLP